MNEIARGFQWLRAKLTASTALTSAAPGGVWQGVAPSGTVAPYVVYTYQGGADVAGVAGIRIMVSGLFQVVAYAPASQDTALAAAADAIDAALQRQSGAAGVDAFTSACVREQPLALDEVRPDGTQWSRLGGVYRLQVYAL